jgi:hypothetical protein
VAPYVGEDVVTAKVNFTKKKRAAKLRDVNSVEVILDTVRGRLELEERLRAPFDQKRALAAARRIDEFRERIGRVDFDSTKEIRKWRDRGRRS